MLCLLSQLFVILSRRVLWGLMLFGHAVSSFMLRQMEYDADRYETRVAGSQTFSATTRRIRQLGAAYLLAQKTVIGFVVQGRFPDDISRVMLRIIEEMTPATVHKIREELSSTTRGGKWPATMFKTSLNTHR